jgi:hypothetical protein
MNLKEGTRRLALLLGVVGAILGGFASYIELQSLIRQRADHMRFEQLTNSDAVKQAKPQSDDPISEFMGLPRDKQLAALQQLPPENQDRLLAQIKARRKDGIKTILWTKDNGVESIETQDGQTLYPTPTPAGWTYLLTALFPILGFLIPWGAVRAIGWVGAGFAESPK